MDSLMNAKPNSGTMGKLAGLRRKFPPANLRTLVNERKIHDLLVSPLVLG